MVTWPRVWCYSELTAHIPSYFCVQRRLIQYVMGEALRTQVSLLFFNVHCNSFFFKRQFPFAFSWSKGQATSSGRHLVLSCPLVQRRRRRRAAGGGKHQSFSLKKEIIAFSPDFCVFL